MEQEHLIILDLLDDGKITVPEALELIEAMDASNDEFLDDYPQPLAFQLCVN